MRSWFHRAAAALSFLVPLAVYVRTHTPTVPFWDSGEFIAVSEILGIPHPPGMPFYVLLGRAALLPRLASAPVTLNILAGVAAAITCLFIYLITTHIARRIVEERPAAGPRAAAVAGSVGPGIPLAGLAAALLVAFSYTFWFNAIEAEVYSLAGMIAALGLWVALVWRDKAPEAGSSRLLLLIGYLVALAVGIHLGVALIAPGVAAFVLLVRPRVLTSGRFWGALAVLAVVGVSVHLYLLIRASLNPPINEADPSTFERLWLVLTRDQYKPPTPLLRRAPVGFQLNEMFGQYLWQQYLMGGRGFVRMLLGLVPFALAALGAVVHTRREQKSFALTAITIFFTSLFLVFYLNFTDREVRSRDYFFTMSFQFIPIWFGLGLVALGSEAGARLRRRQLATAAAGGVGLAVAIAVCVHGFANHDRSRYYFARDLAHNFLIGLPRDAILFTNGDNDTFPLWYAQHVEKERPDVSVVNLSLLNTPWYLKELRDGETGPAVPVRMTDTEIDRLAPVYDRSGRPLSVADQGVLAIVGANNWKRPVYGAMTVPEANWRRLGFEGRVVVEGINLQFLRDRTERQCDAGRTMSLLDGVYRYRGIIGPDGDRLRKLEVDPETEGLVQNYGAAFYGAAIEYVRDDSLEAAAHAFRRALVFAPDVPQVHIGLAAMYLEMNRLNDAEQAIADAMMRWPRMGELFKLRGDLFGLREDLDSAAESYRRAIEMNRDFREPYILLHHIYRRQGRIEDARRTLRDLLAVRPQDESAQRYLAEMERMAAPETTRIPFGTSVSP